jgi:hypothetical protein
MALPDDPPPRFPTRSLWQQFLRWFRRQPQEGPRIHTEIGNPEQVFAQSEANEPKQVEEPRQQVRQLIKQALEAPTAENLADYLSFTTKFRRMAIWNTRMAYIQRPGSHVIASEHEWKAVGRYVLADAVPIIILWPFGPIRFVYELADTGPPIDREAMQDPFAVRGTFSDRVMSKLGMSLKRQKRFRIAIELRRQGFDLAGTAAAQMPLLLLAASALAPTDDRPIGPLLRFEWVELDERCPAGRGQGRAKPGGANP